MAAKSQAKSELDDLIDDEPGTVDDARLGGAAGTWSDMDAGIGTIFTAPLKRKKIDRQIKKNDALVRQITQAMFNLSDEAYDRDSERWDALGTQLFGEDGEKLADFYANLQEGDDASLQGFLQSVAGVQSVEDLFDNPEFYAYLGQTGTEYLDAAGVDESKAAQQAALSKLWEYTTPQVTAAERLISDQASREQEANLQAQRESMQRQQLARGQYGSGAELASALGAIDEQSKRRSSEEMRAQAQAAERAYNALGQYSTQASNMRGQDLDTAKLRADVDQFRSQLNAQKSGAQAQARQQDNANTQNIAQNTFQNQQTVSGNKREDLQNENKTWQDYTSTSSAADTARTAALQEAADKKRADVEQETARLEDARPKGLLGLGVLGL